VWGVAGLRVLRLANPLVRVVLGSRAHGLLSGRLVLLTYRGRRSGREFRVPLRYAETDAGAVVAIAVGADRKQWWRAFRAAGPATLTLRGARIVALGRVAGGAVRETARRAYLDRYPGSARLTGDAAVVVFRAGDG
jgi:deazaflavin-dependent oxidoreductase (nitroreductase family)